jgi:hypothetical protein
LAVYFRTDTTRLTFGELWRISSRTPVFLAGCMNKLLGVRTPARHAVCHHESILEVPADQVPALAQQALLPCVEGFERAGARRAFYHTVPAVNVTGCAAALLPPERNAVIAVAWASAHRAARPGRASCSSGITSQLEDGTFLITSDHRARFNPPPLFKFQRFLGAAPEELMDRHQEALTELASPALPVEDDEQAKQLIVDMKCCNFSWQVSRGVWVPLTAAEMAQLGLAQNNS